jgi:pseudaminic acid cytidylyltransferase
MIAHSIDCALKSGLFDRVLVSTDDEAIAQVAVEFGAETPFLRPPELSDDHAGTAVVIAHAIRWLNEQGVFPTAICCLYATAPFARVDELTQACELLETGRWQFVLAATTYPYPIFRAFRHTGRGLEMIFPEHLSARSQDLPEAMHDAGQFYWGTPAAWLEHPRAFHESSTVVRIPSWRVVDIDHPEDWKRAEQVWWLLNMSGHVSSTSQNIQP